MVGSRILFTEYEVSYFIHFCLQGSSFGRPKNAKIKQHAERSSVNFGAVFAPLCPCDTLLKLIAEGFYEHERTTSCKICILLHKSTFRSYSCVCSASYITCTWLCMIPCYVLVTMAACESFGRLVSWQRCTCRGKLSRAHCVLRTQSLRAINNWVGLEPCTSRGLARRERHIPLGGVFSLSKKPNHAEHFSRFSGGFSLSSSHLRLFWSHDNNDWNIRSRHLTAGWRGLLCFLARGYLFSQLCL